MYQILEKVAEKFAKKSNFSYGEAYDNLSKKEQKLSLDRICRKFLKSDESGTTDTNLTKEKSNKRTIDGTGSDGEEGSESPISKKVRNENKKIESDLFQFKLLYPNIKNSLFLVLRNGRKIQIR